MITALAIMVLFAIALSDSIEGKGKQHFDNVPPVSSKGGGIGLLAILIVIILAILMSGCSSTEVRMANDKAEIKFVELTYWLSIIARIFWGIVWGYVLIKVGWAASIALSNLKISDNVPSHYAPSYAPHYAPSHALNFTQVNKMLPSPLNTQENSAISSQYPTLDTKALLDQRRSILIIGLSGYGKSVTCQSILLSGDNLTVFLHDPHDGAKDSLATRMGIQSLEIDDWINKAEYMLSERKDSRVSSPIAIFAIDELNSVLRRDDRVLKTLESIAQEGRKYGVMALAVSHHPSGRKMGTEVRDSFGVFICHRIKRKTGFLIGLEDPSVATGLEVGEVLVVTEAGESLAKVEKIEKPSLPLITPSEPLLAPSEPLLSDVIDDETDEAVRAFIEGKSLSEAIRDTWGVTGGTAYQSKSKELAKRIRSRLV